MAVAGGRPARHPPGGGCPSSSTGKTHVAGNLAHAAQVVHSLFSTRKWLICRAWNTPNFPFGEGYVRL
jgi:hypothetical protein